MDQRKVIIMHGLQGSGKSTYVADNFPKATVCSADLYPGLHTEAGFQGMVLDDGVPRIKRAHAWCRQQAMEALERGDTLIVVDNTNIQRWEWEPYLRMAESVGATVEHVDLYDGGGLSDEELAKRCKHGVPVHVIARYRRRYEACVPTAPSNS